MARLLQAIIDGLRDSVAEFTGELRAIQTWIVVGGGVLHARSKGTDGSSARTAETCYVPTVVPFDALPLCLCRLLCAYVPVCLCQMS